MENTSVLFHCDQCTCTCIRPFVEKEDYIELLSNRACIGFGPGETIIKQGAFVSDVYFLREGVVKKCIEEKKGKNIVVQVQRKGSFFALPFHGAIERYPYSVVALGQVSVCQIRKHTFLDFINRKPAMCHHLFNWYSVENHYLCRRISSLSTRNNHGKLALSLLYLTEIFEDGETLFESLSRKDLADLASISLESVNKILVELKHERIIDFDSRGLKIIKLELIKTLSEVG